MRPALLAGIAVLAACSGGDSGDRPATSTDRAVLHDRASAPPARIVSLVPSFSNILVALEVGDRLVGRTDFDTAAALSHLPSVGNGLQPSIEAIVSLQPEMVLAFEGTSDPETARRLGELGVPVVSLGADGIEEVLEVIRAIGVLVHRQAEADSLIRETRSALEAVRARTASRPRVRAILLIGGTPPWVAGPGSYMDQLLEVAGGENVFADLDSAFGPVSPELLATRPFDLVLAGPGTTLPPGLEGAPRADLPPGIEIPGPAMAETAAALARILHPDLPW